MVVTSRMVSVFSERGDALSWFYATIVDTPQQYAEIPLEEFAELN